jgi:hypothetical protein
MKHVIRLAQDGRAGKAAKTLASLGLAEPTPTVVEALQNLHPEAEFQSFPEDPTPTVIDEDQVLSALRSFPEGSAPGPSYFRASFLKAAVQCPSTAQGAKTLTALTKVVNLLAGVKVPHDLAPTIV